MLIFYKNFHSNILPVLFHAMIYCGVYQSVRAYLVDLMILFATDLIVEYLVYNILSQRYLVPISFSWIAKT